MGEGVPASTSRSMTTFCSHSLKFATAEGSSPRVSKAGKRRGMTFTCGMEMLSWSARCCGKRENVLSSPWGEMLVGLNRKREDGEIEGALWRVTA